MLQASFEFIPQGRPDVVVLCATCGSPIVLQHFTPGYVHSDYRNAKGECFTCDGKRNKRRRT